MKQLVRPMLAVLAVSVLLASVACGLAGDNKEKGDKTKNAAKEQAKDKEKEEPDPHAAMIGKPAPNIKGDFALNGPLVSLSDLKGKVVLVDFWAVWCGPCIATFPHLIDWQKEYHDKGLEILGVTTYYERIAFDKEKNKTKLVGKIEKDEKTGKKKLVGGLTPMEEQDMLKDFAAYHKLEHRLLMVPKEAMETISSDYHVSGIPTAVVIDRQGIVRMVKVGADDENARDLEKEIKKLLQK
jgi:thiol-disulfide isomerase/thioredoxin